ncbi:MAG TPA: ARMT1-like domain-containing protein, partial [Kofleriaceae bacterium]|nr:ARMT1-like domain-containing protein [Kofleriaceae bacterium]
MSPHLPPPIPAYAEGTFAHFTIKHRLPKILADVKSQVGKGGHDDPRWSALQSAILTGRKLDPQLFAADTPFWRDKLAGLAGTRWSELPFFDLEFLFYHAINSIAADLRPGLDVFASMRGASLCEALPQIARALESTDAIDLEAALLLATSGNEADLSQIVRQEQHVSSLLKDHRHEIIERLQMNDDDTIQLVADNAGAELCFDLVLVDVVLGLRRGAVELQLKPRPMFVSDALITDVEATIAGFDEQGALSRIAKLATRLKQALRDGRLVLRAPADWAEPRHMNALDSNLLSDLRRATLVLV